MPWSLRPTVDRTPIARRNELPRSSRQMARGCRAEGCGEETPGTTWQGKSRWKADVLHICLVQWWTLCWPWRLHPTSQGRTLPTLASSILPPRVNCCRSSAAWGKPAVCINWPQPPAALRLSLFASECLGCTAGRHLLLGSRAPPRVSKSAQTFQVARPCPTKGDRVP